MITFRTITIEQKDNNGELITMSYVGEDFGNHIYCSYLGYHYASWDDFIQSCNSHFQNVINGVENDPNDYADEDLYSW